MYEIENLVYYDLVFIIWRDGRRGHIPAPFFCKTAVGIQFLLALPRAAERNNRYFYCPVCKTHSFYKCLEHKKTGRLSVRKKHVLEAALVHKSMPVSISKIEYVAEVGAALDIEFFNKLDRYLDRFDNCDFPKSLLSVAKIAREIKGGRLTAFERASVLEIWGKITNSNEKS